MRALGHEIFAASGHLSCADRFHSSKETRRMRAPLLDERLIGERTFRAPLPAARFPRIVLGALVIIAGASCKAAPTPQCLQFAADLMPAFAGGLIQKNLRVAK